MISNNEFFSYICLALRPLHHQLITAYPTWSARVLSGGKKTCSATCNYNRYNCTFNSSFLVNIANFLGVWNTFFESY